MQTESAMNPVRWALVLLVLALSPALASADVLGVERIDDVLPFYDGSSVREPRPGEELPPLRVLLSRERYWAQDGHLDVVAQLGDEQPQGELRVQLLGANGQALSRFRISPLPGPRFVFYPAIPDALANGGHGEIEVAWVRGGQTVAEHRQAFRVEVYGEPAPRSGRVSLTVPNDPGVRQVGVPATVGVPFPRGVLDDAANLRLVDEAGNEVPLQVMETARWSKFGSVRWVLCDFTVDLDGGPRTLHLEYGPDVSRTERAAISVTETDGFPVVDAGRLRFDRGLWFDAAGDGNFVKVLEERGLSGAFVEHEDGRFYRAPLADRYEVEESGPEKVVLKREGWYQEEDGDRAFCQYIIRYVIHRDSPLARVFHTWLFTGDGNRDRIRNMGWQFALPDGFERRGFLTAFGDESEWADADYLVQWDYDHFDLVSDGQMDARAEARATGVAAARGNGVNLYFGTKDFWQNYPSELEFRDGSLWFHNWPRHNRPAGHTFDKELLSTTGETPPPSSAARYALEDPDSLNLAEWKLNSIQLRFAHEGEVLDFRLPEAFAEDPIWEEAVGERRGLHNYHWEKGEPETANAQGISRTEEMWLYLTTEDTGAEGVLEGLEKETLRAIADPVWVAQSGAFGDIRHQDWENYPDHERIYELVAFAPPVWAERLGAYGMWIHGDVPAWNPRLENKTTNLYRAYREGHHGWPYAWLPFARSGDPRLLKNVEASTRQMIDAYYCHYVSEDVALSVGPNKYRYPGRWERSLMPWAARAGTSTRGYTSHSDHFWHSWFLTGYHRGRDMALTWGEHTKVEQTGKGSWFDRRRGPISHDRTRFALGVSYLDMYEATLDPWFLVATHEVNRMNVGEYLTGGLSRVDFWRPWGRDFLRFTGSEEFAEDYLAMVEDPNQWHHLRGSGWGGGRGGGASRMEPHAYAWRLTGEDYYLGRVAGMLDMAKARVFDGDEPWYRLGWETSGGQVQVSMWVPWWLRLFPAGLAVLHEGADQATPVGHMFHVGSEPGEWAQGESRHLTPVIALKKQAGEPVPIFLSSRWASDPMEYRVVGPDGEIALRGSWDARQSEQVEIPADAPAGVYRFQGAFESSSRFGLPLSEWGIPEVMELAPGDPLPRAGRETRYAFMVPEEVERFVVSFDDAEQRMSVWDPEGNRVWDVNDPQDDPTRAEIEVKPEHTGRLWRVTVGSSWSPRIRMDGQIPPIYAVDPGRWFNPREEERP